MNRGMPVLSDSLLEALHADATLWPGRLDPAGRGRLEALLSRLPGEVRTALLASLIDPEANAWARGAVLGIELAEAAGARVVGMRTDDLIELCSPQGDPFGLSALGFAGAGGPRGDPEAAARLLSALDATFGHRPYVVHLRRPLPASLDPAPIARAVRLWLSAVDGDLGAERHAPYVDDGIEIDLTLAEGPGVAGRLLTIGPVDSLERLSAVRERVVGALSGLEQSVGALPVVLVLAAARPWGLPRGFIQQILYGTPAEVWSSRDRGSQSYGASFDPANRSLFSDPVCRTLASLWWLDPASPVDPLAIRSRAHDNPWADTALELSVPGPRFCCLELRDDRTAEMRWETGGT
ncbi:MAG TPA: hypothetical protein ENK18_23360 [Deltaproteobacteria bacterium]|nr:hypothetical protein [Deltaproteobacteria bacterium]